MLFRGQYEKGKKKERTVVKEQEEKGKINGKLNLNSKTDAKGGNSEGQKDA
jgi:hypothetical protein